MSRSAYEYIYRQSDEDESVDRFEIHIKEQTAGVDRPDTAPDGTT